MTPNELDQSEDLYEGGHIAENLDQNREQIDDGIESAANENDRDDELDESSDESDEERAVALLIDRNQLSGPNVEVPQNGHDYLNAVRAERARLPSLVGVPLSDEEKQKFQRRLKSSGRLRSGLQQIMSRYGHLSMTEEHPEEARSESSGELNYRDEILNNFKTLRAHVDEIRGSEHAKMNGSYDDDVQISEKEIKQQHDIAERRASDLVKMMELGQRPQVTCLINCSQLELHKTLERLADQCDITPNHSTIHSDWMFSIMAALRDPIEPDISSTLRRIARICISKRELLKKKRDKAAAAAAKQSSYVASSSASQEHRSRGGSKKSGPEGENNEELVRKLEEEEYRSSLLIICIVRHYFGQADLR